ncbi:MAG: AraC family transcriptional regulator [Desulfobacter sp.]|nr:MAG: AraC family transcriptional regulator [Desulfobacter sp.]
MKPKTDVIYHRDPALPGIDICRAVNSRHRFPLHYHDDLYIISLVTSGTCYCLGEGQSEAVAGPGGITLLNPGQIHSGIPVNNGRIGYTNCYLSLPAMASLARGMGPAGSAAPEFTASVLRNPIVTALLQHLFATLLTSRDPLEKEALLVSACHFILSRYGRNNGNDRGNRLRHQPVIQARELLSGRLDQKLTLAEVAQNVGLSRYHFLRTFKRETGISPHLYRTLKRLEAAKGLLTGGMPPAQVALETGFTDQSHFSNTFRRYLGATPKQYLAQH